MLIVYFDGVCGLCNELVDWLMRKDSQGKFRFAPLQGETARRELPSTDVENLASIVISKNQAVYRQSDAIVQLLLELPGWGPAARALQLIPRPLRDLGYKLVAKNRYQVWGKKETCRIPTKEERARFLP